MSEWINDSDLPKLQSIQLNNFALQGDDGDDQKTIQIEPFYFKNTLTMKSEIDCDTL